MEIGFGTGFAPSPADIAKRAQSYCLPVTKGQPSACACMWACAALAPPQRLATHYLAQKTPRHVIVLKGFLEHPTPAVTFPQRTSFMRHVAISVSR